MHGCAGNVALLTRVRGNAKMPAMAIEPHWMLSRPSSAVTTTTRSPSRTTLLAICPPWAITTPQ